MVREVFTEIICAPTSHDHLKVVYIVIAQLNFNHCMGILMDGSKFLGHMLTWKIRTYFGGGYIVTARLNFGHCIEKIKFLPSYKCLVFVIFWVRKCSPLVMIEYHKIRRKVWLHKLWVTTVLGFFHVCPKIRRKVWLHELWVTTVLGFFHVCPKIRRSL